MGDTVCHSGNTAPKFECGKVRSVNQSIDYGSVVIDGLTTTDACSQGGDSGGAWLRGTEAVGLHSGGNSSCVANDDNSIFQPVKEALTRWNLTLLTGIPDPGDDDEAPTTPGNPRSTGTTSNSVSLAWDAAVDNIGVTGYDVYNGGTLATTVAGTTATVSGLTADTGYSFTVQAKDAAGNKSKAESGGDGADPAGEPGWRRTFANGTDYPIRDYQTVVSPVRSTATGRADQPVQGDGRRQPHLPGGPEHQPGLPERPLVLPAAVRRQHVPPAARQQDLHGPDRYRERRRHLDPPHRRQRPRRHRHPHQLVHHPLTISWAGVSWGHASACRPSLLKVGGGGRGWSGRQGA